MIHSLGRLASLRSAGINQAVLKSRNELSVCLFMKVKVVSSLSLKKETNKDILIWNWLFLGINRIRIVLSDRCRCVKIQPPVYWYIELKTTWQQGWKTSHRKQEAPPFFKINQPSDLNSDASRTHLANKHLQKSRSDIKERTRVRCESSCHRREEEARRKWIRGPSKAITTAVPTVGGRNRCQNANPGG